MHSKARPFSLIADDIVAILTASESLQDFAEEENLTSVSVPEVRTELIIRMDAEKRELAEWLDSFIDRYTSRYKFERYLRQQFGKIPPTQGGSTLELMNFWLSQRGMPTSEVQARPRALYRELKEFSCSRLIRTGEVPPDMRRAYKHLRQLLRYLCWYYQWSLRTSEARLSLLADDATGGEGTDTDIADGLVRLDVAGLARVMDRIRACRRNPFTKDFDEKPFRILDDMALKGVTDLQAAYTVLQRQTDAHSDVDDKTAVSDFYDCLNGLIKNWDAHQVLPAPKGRPPLFIPTGGRLTTIERDEIHSKGKAKCEIPGTYFELFMLPDSEQLNTRDTLLLPTPPIDDSGATENERKKPPVRLTCEFLKCLPEGDAWRDSDWDLPKPQQSPIAPVVVRQHCVVLLFAANSDEEFNTLKRKSLKLKRQRDMGQTLLPLRDVANILELMAAKRFRRERDSDQHDMVGDESKSTASSDPPWKFLKTFSRFVHRTGQGGKGRRSGEVKETGQLIQLFVLRHDRDDRRQYNLNVSQARLLLLWHLLKDITHEIFNQSVEIPPADRGEQDFGSVVDSHSVHQRQRGRSRLPRIVSELRSALGDDNDLIPAGRGNTYRIHAETHVFVVPPSEWPWRDWTRLDAIVQR